VKYYLTMEQADLKYWRKHQPRAAQRAYRMMKFVYHLASTAAWFPRWLARRDEQSELKLRGHANNLVWLTTGRPLVR